MASVTAAKDYHNMDTIKLENKTFVPTLSGTSGPLVVLSSHRPPKTALQLIAKPAHHVAEVVVKTALDCKKVALQIAVAFLAKLVSLGRSFLKYVKKDFAKKEGVPLEGLVVYKFGTKGMGRIVKNIL
uniref:Uncharacterized protein n=1 Tax=Cuerna arida TaxID=1464854 RepID=A0A1B6G504_9HEMI